MQISFPQTGYSHHHLTFNLWTIFMLKVRLHQKTRIYQGQDYKYIIINSLFHYLLVIFFLHIFENDFQISFEIWADFTNHGDFIKPLKLKHRNSSSHFWIFFCLRTINHQFKQIQSSIPNIIVIHWAIFYREQLFIRSVIFIIALACDYTYCLCYYFWFHMLVQFL